MNFGDEFNATRLLVHKHLSNLHRHLQPQKDLHRNIVKENNSTHQPNNKSELQVSTKIREQLHLTSTCTLTVELSDVLIGC